VTRETHDSDLNNTTRLPFTTLHTKQINNTKTQMLRTLIPKTECTPSIHRAKEIKHNVIPTISLTT